ncbi:MAG: GntR family transcriptional regulator [Sulfitobacter sp.]|nr:GntR family transcriptional regulator [Sulfitobacter sp.]
MKKPKDTVIQTIMAQIEDGTIMPGDPIEEKDIIDACEVSRTPVREALLKLEADGLIIRHPRKGAQLFRPDTDQFLAILEVHASLEAQAAELAAGRLSPEQEVILRDCTRACVTLASHKGTDRHREYYELNRQFHAAIADATQNPYLIEMIKLNARKLMAHYRLRYRTPGAIEKSAQEHEVICQHIINRDGTAARAAMLEHFNYDRESVMNMIASVG